MTAIPSQRRNDYLTPEGHYQEARRLLWVIDGELQSDKPRTIGDLAVIALAHAVTALAAAEFEDDQADEGEPYCVTCGVPLGIFHGHGDGWHHWRGNGTAESPVELFDADHAPEVAWRPAGAQ